MKILSIQSYHPVNYKKNSPKTNFRGNFGIHDFSHGHGYEQYAKDLWTRLQDNKEKIYAHLDSLTVDFDGKNGAF